MDRNPFHIRRGGAYRRQQSHSGHQEEEDLQPEQGNPQHTGPGPPRGQGRGRRGRGGGRENGQGRGRDRRGSDHRRGQDLSQKVGRGQGRRQEHGQSRHDGHGQGHDQELGQWRSQWQDHGHKNDRQQGRDKRRDQGRDQGCNQGRDQRREQGRDHKCDQGHDQKREQGGDEVRDQGRHQREIAHRDDRTHDPKERTQKKERPVKQPGYKMLESLLTDEKSPAEIVQELSSFGQGLKNLLSGRDIRRDLMALLIEVLAKVCDCDSSPQSQLRVLNIVLDSDFLINLGKHITAMTTEVNQEYLRRVPRQIGFILKLMKTLIQRLQSSTKDVHVVLGIIHFTANALETKGYSLDADTTVLLEQLLSCCLKTEEEKQRSEYHQRRDTEGPPPNDFRQISVFPGLREIMTKAESYLRANVVQGKYQDLNHYLDVQFRLLRQDFLEPLREGISEYHNSLTSRATNIGQSKAISIYHDVRVQFPVCTNEGITHRVSFDATRFGKIRWQATKRLTFGSLVCLSKDNFQSIIFATVANRNPKDLEQGLVDLRFQHMWQILVSDSSDVFIMAESPAFFEAYRHVLQGLQKTKDTLPLQRYIVDVSSEVLPPRYLQTNRHATYDLSYFISVEKDSDDDGAPNRTTAKRIAQAKGVDVLSPSQWPRAENSYLDESQLQAVQAALTQELAIIQGPPGTGKTFIGLKIVEALLRNGRVWNYWGGRVPILVVCYTNHALDQFLEGILEFDQNIVRVGGRSKSEQMKGKNLNYLRIEQRQSESFQTVIRRRTRGILKERYLIRHHMEMSQKHIERSMNGIISEDHLKPFMKQGHYATLSSKSGRSHSGFSSVILEWLGFSITRQGAFTNAWEEDDVQDSPVEEEEEEEESDVEEEAELIADLRVLDDDDEDLTLADEENFMENHVVLNISALYHEEADEDGWQIQTDSKKRMKRRLVRDLRKLDRMSTKDAETIHDVWAMADINDRWRLYRYWVHEYCQEQRRRMNSVQAKYENLSQELKEVRVEEDLAILRQANVIGMTTTGAAKHRSVLQRLGPKIIIVEEAAEVLEAHIITTLSSDCQHLILIGDHQQLRPNPAVYRLAKDFDLDLSLFERMIRNKVPYQTLVKQHRMRPEISSIMKNNFYPKLQDHEAVQSYPEVAGISSNVFFLHHDFEEQTVDDSKSKSNLHEAEVLVGLCKYLIQQGQYEPRQITILTAYSGQLFNFKRLMKRSEIFKGVRVCVVDNFQGEENDIILLSLVRSNKKGSIGFLKVSNRMCVALSRARHGFFCVGNFQGLKSQSDLWKDIVQEVQRKGFLGQHLSLICRNHPERITPISTAQDFLDVPDGGCNLPCEFRLGCGHSCTRQCHPTDPEHKDFTCMKTCGKVFKCGHQCPLPCFRPCGECTHRVDKILPCRHHNQVPCYLDPELAFCQKPCTKELPCGHRCRQECGVKPCPVRCQEDVVHSDWPCGHVVSGKCSDEPEDCPMSCGTFLECSHQCQGSCGACKRGRLHVQCTQRCNRILVCGHECDAQCTRDCPPCKEKCENRCVHSKCPNRCGDPCTPCQEPCPWRCPHYTCSKKCSEACDRPPCDKPCPEKLRCGHPCIGLCGEPCPSKCRVCHKDEVTEIFFGSEDEPDVRFVQLDDCGHIFEVENLDYWMRVENEEERSIQLKKCPRCNIPIRRNLRYGSVINETLRDIEVVKARVFGDEAEIASKEQQINQRLSEMKGFDCIKDQMQSKRLSLAELLVVENRLNLLTAIQPLIKKANAAVSSFTSQLKEQKKGLSELEQRLLKPCMYLSQQELEDCSREIQRLSMCIELHHIKNKLPSTKRNNAVLKSAEDLLLNGKPLEESERENAQTLLTKLRSQCTGLGISDEERVMIVKAVGLSQGHWYKCPNGHCYAIGECGGATEESRCPECMAKIGGTCHRLLDDNAVATEMDGARHGAWSEQANLANYDPRLL